MDKHNSKDTAASLYPKQFSNFGNFSTFLLFSRRTKYIPLCNTLIQNDSCNVKMTQKKALCKILVSIYFLKFNFKLQMWHSYLWMEGWTESSKLKSCA